MFIRTKCTSNIILVLAFNGNLLKNLDCLI